MVDEADRLLDASMAPDLDTIFGAMPPATKRHTLLYSATMTKNLERIEALAGGSLQQRLRWHAPVVAATCHCPCGSGGTHRCMLGEGAVRTLRSAVLVMTYCLCCVSCGPVHRPFKWSLAENPTTVRQLAQFYLLVSRPAKMSYLAHIMRTQGPLAEEGADDGGVRRGHARLRVMLRMYSRPPTPVVVREWCCRV